MNHVAWPIDDAPPQAWGGKARALRNLWESGLEIPGWFVLTPTALECGVPRSEGDRLDQLRGITPGEEVMTALSSALERLCPDGRPVAVRSSGSDEDGKAFSFAGQFETVLGVNPRAPASVRQAVERVWRSAFSERVTAYRRENGLPEEPPFPSVLVQRMVDAKVAGVAFGADPVTGRRGVAVVSAVYGLGSALVDGEVDADTWRVDRDGVIEERHVATKRVARLMRSTLAGERVAGESAGVETVSLPDEQAHRPSLADDQVRQVAEMARRAGDHFGRAQDIEWAMEDGRLFLLQSRPITSLSSLPDADGVLRVWDNSNIAESYNGVTTPLTFSFARRVYEHAYRQFCRIMGVPGATIEEHADMFPNMLGLVKGRVYYNLINWYRLIAMLPGFSVNRRFMEQMMGVKEGLPESIVAALDRATVADRMRDAVRLGGTLAGIVRHQVMLPWSIRRFHQRLREALDSPPRSLSRMRSDELVAHYRDLERRLLTRWDAPLVNDFFAMIFYGVLRRLATRWCHDTDETLQNGLITGQGDIISAEPVRRVQEMARHALALEREQTGLVTLLCHGSPRAIRERAPDLALRVENYLETYGDRCLEELKLESATLQDDPLPLWRSIGHLARRLQLQGLPQETEAGRVQEMRAQAEAKVLDALWRNPLRHGIFGWILKNARARVRDRENLRFERTRLFGRVRKIFVELGRRLAEAEVIDDPRDVFWLEVGEVLGFVEGAGSTTSLRGLVEVRRTEFARHLEQESPPGRLQTRGMASLERAVMVPETPSEPLAGATGEERSGIGCCPGTVCGEARVITDPRHARLEPGQVLVAARTDPGWVLLFPSASGILVEHGSLLSHSAIVAREMGIPAVVGVPGLTSWLRSGDRVVFDGATGKVKRVEAVPS